MRLGVSISGLTRSRGEVTSHGDESCARMHLRHLRLQNGPTGVQVVTNSGECCELRPPWLEGAWLLMVRLQPSFLQGVRAGAEVVEAAMVASGGRPIAALPATFWWRVWCCPLLAGRARGRRRFLRRRLL